MLKKKKFCSKCKKSLPEKNFAFYEKNARRFSYCKACWLDYLNNYHKTSPVYKAWLKSNRDRLNEHNKVKYALKKAAHLDWCSLCRKFNKRHKNCTGFIGHAKKGQARKVCMCKIN